MTSLCGTFSESDVKSSHMTHAAYPGVTVSQGSRLPPGIDEDINVKSVSLAYISSNPDLQNVTEEAFPNPIDNFRLEQPG